MTVKVLVSYATKNHSTAEIARTITEVLREQGLESDTRHVTQIGDVRAYDAVVLGSALYAGRWLRDARRFARHNARALDQTPVWLFSSGPLDTSAGERDIPPVRAARRALVLLDAKEHVTFGGRLVEGARGRVAHLIIRSGKGGDFRDFERISAWARHIAATLREEAAVGPKGR
ncbi:MULTISPECIES: flavodoxin domain-containing protein [Streptomyces]